jgi:hypothetical protein
VGDQLVDITGIDATIKVAKRRAWQRILHGAIPG